MAVTTGLRSIRTAADTPLVPRSRAPQNLYLYRASVSSASRAACFAVQGAALGNDASLFESLGWSKDAYLSCLSQQFHGTASPTSHKITKVRVKSNTVDEEQHLHTAVGGAVCEESWLHAENIQETRTYRTAT